MNAKWIVVSVVTVAAVVFLATRERRNETIERIADAAHALNGTSEDAQPKIVAEQQRKERIRQSTTWTPENQVQHPVEYCQAQIEEVSRLSKAHDALLHQLLTVKSSLGRTIEDSSAQVAVLDKFLVEAKAAYRKAEASNSWPMTLNGFTLSREKAQERIVEAANKLPTLRQRTENAKSNLTRIEKKIDAAHAEQRKLVALRERLETTITDIKTRKILDGEKGISDTLNAINDTLNALVPQDGSPSLDDLTAPDAKAEKEKSFAAIMAE